MAASAEAVCPLCGGGASRLVRPHPDFAATRIHACESCGFWFGAPAPSPDELRRYYETTYGQQRTWSRSREYLTLMRRRAAAQWEFIGPERNGIRSAVDVGCGVGALVATLTAAGVDAAGYDSDATVIAVGRSRLRANIHAEYVAAPPAGAAPRDLLCLSHLVEHFADPVQELGRLLAWVRPGGWVFIEVPNCTEAMFAPGIETESHLGFFTAQAMESLAGRLRLEVVRCAVCGPISEDYYRARLLRLKAEAGRSRALGARLWRLAARWARRLQPPRTEFDGEFSTVAKAGDRSRLWLRVLLHRPAA